MNKTMVILALLSLFGCTQEAPKFDYDNNDFKNTVKIMAEDAVNAYYGDLQRVAKTCEAYTKCLNEEVRMLLYGGYYACYVIRNKKMIRIESCERYDE